MSYKSRLLWVEVLVWSAIVLIVVTFLARIFFWQHIRDAEDNFFAWLGISPDFHEVLKGIAALLCLIYMFMRHRISKRREERANGGVSRVGTEPPP